MPFLALTLELNDLDPEATEEACFEAGALSVTLTDVRDDAILEPLPGEVRLWPHTRLQALFAEGTSPDVTVAAVAEKLGIPPQRIETKKVEDRVWEREWLKDFHAMRFGERLWICPQHEQVDDPQAVVVKLDPGLAFGTGTHATTALCLSWLDGHLKTHARVIDYGCGSGVLALAAAKLGALEAFCFDIDAQALVATRDNAVTNEIADRIRTCESPDQLPRGVDLLLANILSGPLCALAPSFAELVRPGGSLVLSGLLEQDEREVTRAYDAWFDMRPFGTRSGWVALSGTRRS